MKKLKVGVVGATGMVGQTFIQILQEKKFPIELLRPYASEKSIGQKIELFDQSYPIEVLKEKCFQGLDLVFFSSGDEISKEWAPKAVADGAFAIDNSAAFRMDSNIPLIVPEVNGDLLLKLKNKPQIIANPNCTTIQLVMVMNSIQKNFGIHAIKLASYQAVSGAGAEAYQELMNQVSETNPQAKIFPHPIAFNCIPQIGSFNVHGYSSEEMKVTKETKKILRQDDLKVSAFAVRVPVLNAHAEAVWVTMNKSTTKNELINILSKAPGVIVQDDPTQAIYPQQYQVSGQDEIYVGRIHQDIDEPNTWMMWIVGDNIRKGAALNGIQIAEQLFSIS